MLHHPEYGRRFAEVLKKELPRVPLLDNFATLARVGRELATLHVGYEAVEPWPGLRWDWTHGVPASWRVEKMVLSKDKTTLKVNDSLTLAEIPPETTQYRLGNRSALEWVVDQYVVKRDKATGSITSDPNREDDPHYIANLAARVVTVSVKTVGLVASLPAWPASPQTSSLPEVSA